MRGCRSLGYGIYKTLLFFLSCWYLRLHRKAGWDDLTCFGRLCVCFSLFDRQVYLLAVHLREGTSLVAEDLFSVNNPRELGNIC